MRRIPAHISKFTYDDGALSLSNAVLGAGYRNGGKEAHSFVDYGKDVWKLGDRQNGSVAFSGKSTADFGL